MSEPVQVLVEHDEFDWQEMEGVPLAKAAKYLTELAKKLPADATLEEYWYGYEDMYIRVTSFRDETNEERQRREEQERWALELAKKQKEKDKKRAERLKEYHKLKKEFGG